MRPLLGLPAGGDPHPGGLQLREQNPRRLQLRDPHPGGLQLREQNPRRLQLRDPHPGGLQLREQNPRRLQLRDPHPGGLQLREQNPRRLPHPHLRLGTAPPRPRRLPRRPQLRLRVPADGPRHLRAHTAAAVHAGARRAQAHLVQQPGHLPRRGSLVPHRPARHLDVCARPRVGLPLDHRPGPLVPRQPGGGIDDSPWPRLGLRSRRAGPVHAGARRAQAHLVQQPGHLPRRGSLVPHRPARHLDVCARPRVGLPLDHRPGPLVPRQPGGGIDDSPWPRLGLRSRRAGPVHAGARRAQAHLVQQPGHLPRRPSGV